MWKRAWFVYKTLYAWTPLTEGLSIDAENRCALSVNTLGNMQPKLSDKTEHKVSGRYVWRHLFDSAYPWMFEEVYGPEPMQEFYHDEWGTYMKRCAHGPTYHETVPCGALCCPWQRKEYGLVEFFFKNEPSQRQFALPANCKPMEADIYRILRITTHTRPASNAPSYMEGRVVPGLAIPMVPLPHQNLVGIRRALQARPEKGDETREALERGRSPFRRTQVGGTRHLSDRASTLCWLRS